MVGDSLIVGGRRTPASLEGVSMGEGGLCQVVYSPVAMVVVEFEVKVVNICGEDGYDGHGPGSSEKECGKSSKFEHSTCQRDHVVSEFQRT